jgi:hypothetical protein
MARMRRLCSAHSTVFRRVAKGALPARGKIEAQAGRAWYRYAVFEGGPCGAFTGVAGAAVGGIVIVRFVLVCVAGFERPPLARRSQGIAVARLAFVCVAFEGLGNEIAEMKACSRRR